MTGEVERKIEASRMLKDLASLDKETWMLIEHLNWEGVARLRELLAASPPAPAEVEPVAWVSLHALAVMKVNGSAGTSLRQKRLNAGDAPLYTAEALSAAVAQARRQALEQAACTVEGHAFRPKFELEEAARAIRDLSDAAPAEEG